MTNPSAAPEGPAFESAAPAVERRDRNIAFVCAVLLLIGMPVGWLPGSTSDVIGMCVIGLAVLAIMAGLILWFLPRERTHPTSRVNRTALILGIVAIITCGVFWTGLPFAVGAAALALGVSQRESVGAGEGRGKATTGAVLGGIAVLASFVLLLIG
ncbi:MAG TPA: hypothetical protein VF032_20660 [Thermoleophilaceae bacterium]